MAFDGKAFGLDIVAVVRDYVERQVSPVLLRLQELEARLQELPTPKDGKDGKDADPLAVQQIVALALQDFEFPVPEPYRPSEGDIEAWSARAAALVSLPDPPPPPDPPEIDPQFVREIATEEIRAALASHAGTDAILEQIRAELPEAAERAVAGLPVPKDGRSVSVAEIIPELLPTLRELIEGLVAEIPRPKDGVGLAGMLIDRGGNLVATLTNGSAQALGPVVGRSVEIAEIEQLIEQKLNAIPKPKDGVGVSGLLIDREGSLIVTMSNGSVSSLGRVVGRDADMERLQKEIEERIAAIPIPKDGKDGLNGRDGADGRDGERGLDGAPGVNGRDGVDGLNGRDGADGRDGEKGLDGAPGSDGRDGVDGVNGRDGENGKDGRDGIDGAPGRDGENGKDGKDGRDGTDGIDGTLDLAVPDDVAENVAKAIRMLSETVPIESASFPAESAARNVHFHMPPVIMPEVKFPETVVRVAAPSVNIAPPVISVPEPRKRLTRTVVKKHDEKGRIKEFEQEEL